MDPLEETATRFITQAPACDYWTLRLVEETSDHLEVRQGVVEPSAIGLSLGAMITVVTEGGVGYAATSDLRPAGLKTAVDTARRWAAAHARYGLFDGAIFPRSDLRAEYRSPVAEPWDALGLADKLGLLREANEALDLDERIVDWSAWLAWRQIRQLLITSDGGADRSGLDLCLPGPGGGRE